jgi:hypothetical protein
MERCANYEATIPNLASQIAQLEKDLAEERIDHQATLGILRELRNTDAVAELENTRELLAEARARIGILAGGLDTISRARYAELQRLERKDRLVPVEECDTMKREWSEMWRAKNGAEMQLLMMRETLATAQEQSARREIELCEALKKLHAIEKEPKP